MLNSYCKKICYIAEMNWFFGLPMGETKITK